MTSLHGTPRFNGWGQRTSVLLQIATVLALVFYHSPSQTLPWVTSLKSPKLASPTTVDSRPDQSNCSRRNHYHSAANDDEASSHPFVSSFCLWILTAFDDEVRKTDSNVCAAMVVFWLGTVVFAKCCLIMAEGGKYLRWKDSMALVAAMEPELWLSNLVASQSLFP